MQKQIYIFQQEQYDGEWPPESAAECIAWFKSKVAEVPEEYRDAARIEIDSASGYEGEHYGRICISYSRPETDEETRERESAMERGRADQVARLEAQLARLKNN